ncbi:MAG: ATP-binding cassette domain-containing protein [Lachnospiraceae bacterium]|nr:ATP-binding cassette domain-containing protein [Lachnospiraceae bacterium]
MIEIEHLTKKYGDHVAVDDLNLTIEPGRIYGFLGPNGAGKSTTMNIITGYLAATDGKVCVNGYDMVKDPVRAKACIGYLPEIPPLYPDMTVLEYLTFVAELKSIPKKDREEAVDEVCITTGISDVAGRLIRNLSKGYKQRVGLAQAIIGDPDIIILDEPTVGLDPAQIIEIRNLITELGKDHTVILSSHILTEISAVCSYVFIISKGRLVADDETEALMTRMKGSQEVDITLQASTVLTDTGSILQSIPGVDHIESMGDNGHGEIRYRLHAEPDRDIRADVFGIAAERGLTLLEMRSQSRSLEDIFLELTADDASAGGAETEETETETAETEESETETAETEETETETAETEKAEADKSETEPAETQIDDRSVIEDIENGGEE